MREVVACSIASLVAACNFGEHIAAAPIDGAVAVDGMGIDAGDSTPDAPEGPGSCTPGADGDGDDIADCDELGDGDPFTDPARFNGLHAIIGRQPQLSGGCNWLDTWAEVEHELGEVKREQDIRAGWSFDTMANRYDDASYGFAPNWTAAESDGFNIVYRGQVYLTAGRHCFTVDIGGTSNRCAQVYLSLGAPATTALVETGFEAAAGAATRCVDIDAARAAPIDIVYRNFYFIAARSRLDVRHCAGTGGADCTPATTLPATMVQVPP